MRFSFDRFDFIEPDAGTQRPAVIDAAGTLGWQQLAQAVEQWEQQALARGARRDEPLLITGHKETAFLVAILGCLRLGVPFVPVDVINPPERMARIANVSLEELGQQIFSASWSDDKTPEELLFTDFKDFHIAGHDLGVGQITCVNSAHILER